MVDSEKLLRRVMIRRVSCVSAVLLSVFLSAGWMYAQSTFGSFTGTVKDPSGAVIPGATVDVTNEGTGSTRHITTSSSGVFNVPNLDLGSYKVRVTANGFSTYERTGLRLMANQVIDLPIELPLGTTTGVVEVRA